MQTLKNLMQTLKNLLADARVEAALIALAMAVAGYFGFACASMPKLSPVQQRALDVHACFVSAPEPVLGPLTDEFLRAALAGGDLAKALIVHGVPIEDVAKAAAEFEACGRKAVQGAQPLALPDGRDS